MTSAARVRTGRGSLEAAVTGTLAGACSDALAAGAGGCDPVVRAGRAGQVAGPSPGPPARSVQAAPLGAATPHCEAGRHFPRNPTSASPPTPVTAHNGSGARGVQRGDPTEAGAEVRRGVATEASARVS